MATFAYEAIDKKGNAVKGSVEAESIDLARAEIKNQGVTLLDLKEQSALNKDINIDIGGAPKPRDLGVFCRQFVSMLRAGVTILDALKMLGDATENKKLKEAINGVRVATEKGDTLSSAIASYPKVFPELMVNMVAAGEASGSLDIAMERMSTQFERSAKTAGMVKKAMVYPIVVCIVMIVVVIVMLTVVVPSYVDMFDDLGTELPGITKAVMAVSDFIVARWFILLPVVIALVVGVITFSKTDTGKHFFGKLAIKIPAISNLVVKSASAQMARTLSTLLAAGIPLVEAVEIVSQIMTNVYFREALEDAKSEVMVGQPLSRPLETCGLFPPMVYYMVRIGEETGNNEEMLDRLADYYEEEVEMAVAGLMAAMEPAIIVVLAGVVGVILAACMSPMLTMYQALDNL